MTYDVLGAGALDYMPCRYDGSKLLFRGPERRLDAPYVAFLGGTATYGKFIKAPFPALVESGLGVNCINFGIANAGVDVLLNDSFLTAACCGAEVTVMQIIGTQNLSNRFYTVHPRRNDRFVRASALLASIYPEVDFAEFHFNKHMLGRLYNVSADRFLAVRKELQTAWLARMKLLLRQVTGKVVLVWFADHAPMSNGTASLDPVNAASPLFVTRELLEALKQDAAAYVEVVATPESADAATEGMVFSQMEAPAAAEMMGPRAHGELAHTLGQVLQDLV
ncbi:hypothetical protein So717_27200 [Roseobacter cerasinus]|uniref:DUF6473 domain-containing protein n=1 Tax=Roseobacter cerasinus TaxID=2602289 RepID=A0A640VT32_9RHOB|nr:DUF6473 family protein [Roseobacter cerasinus]GFE50967.1 hypothetical protein So717_27200 [Roseobacter cerasinus]